jgi:hypothetical protein
VTDLNKRRAKEHSYLTGGRISRQNAGMLQNACELQHITKRLWTHGQIQKTFCSRERSFSIPKKVKQRGEKETESESHEPGYVSLHLVDIVQTNEWFANFDDLDNRSDFHNVRMRSEPGINKSWQSIEHNAVRNFV